jgi:putative endonuclease
MNQQKITPSQKGMQMEHLALTYLKRQGLRLLVRNYRCKMGEIDIIMLHNHDLVFVEVRYRNQAYYGSSSESVHQYKQAKLIKTAQYYLLTHKLYANLTSRFDIIAIDKIAHNYKIEWLQNVIELTS